MDIKGRVLPKRKTTIRKLNHSKDTTSDPCILFISTNLGGKKETNCISTSPIKVGKPNKVAYMVDGNIKHPQTHIIKIWKQRNSQSSFKIPNDNEKAGSGGKYVKKTNKAQGGSMKRRKCTRRKC